MPELKPRTAVVHIYQGDAPDELDRLEQRIDAAEAYEKNAGPRTLDEGELESIVLRRQHAALVEQAQAEAISVRLKSLGRRTWNSLAEKHPPREDNEFDEFAGVNQKTFFDEAVPLALIEPEFDGERDRDEFFENLAPVDWAQIETKFWKLNMAVTADPKRLPASAPTLLSDETRISPTD